MAKEETISMPHLPRMVSLIAQFTSVFTGFVNRRCVSFVLSLKESGMFGQIRNYSLLSAGLCLAYLGLLAAPNTAFASDDAIRNKLARQDCVRGKFKDYYLQGRGGDPAPDYKGRVFKLSQNYPTQLPPKESYPWEKIAFKNGGPVDPEAYLQALLAYGLEGNIGVDF